MEERLEKLEQDMAIAKEVIAGLLESLVIDSWYCACAQASGKKAKELIDHCEEKDFFELERN